MLTGEQIDMWDYWDEQQHNDHVGKSVLQMVDEFAETTKQEPDADLYLRLIDEEYKEFCHSTSDENDLKELADLVYVAYGYALANGWDLDEAVRRVHENNLGRCTQPDGSIKRREDGKILKNKDYPKVDLSDLI